MSPRTSRQRFLVMGAALGAGRCGKGGMVTDGEASGCNVKRGSDKAESGHQGTTCLRI